MAPRANWKGLLRIAELTCPVALFTAVSTSERIAFHTINRATGHRVRREYVDGDTGKPVERDDQVKGYAVAGDDHVVLKPEEIAAVMPESDKVLEVSAFVTCRDIDDAFFDKPYYLAASDPSAMEAFTLIREGLRAAGVAAIARTVLFRRMRSVLIRAHGPGLIATTLKFDYEVRPADDAFADISRIEIKGEMLDLARHIIRTKMGEFDAAAFDDRYEAALAELVKAKQEGRKIERPQGRDGGKVVDLMAALRESAGVGAKGRPSRGKKADAPLRRGGNRADA